MPDSPESTLANSSLNRETPPEHRPMLFSTSKTNPYSTSAYPLPLQMQKHCPYESLQWQNLWFALIFLLQLLAFYVCLVLALYAHGLRPLYTLDGDQTVPLLGAPLGMIFSSELIAFALLLLGALLLYVGPMVSTGTTFVLLPTLAILLTAYLVYYRLFYGFAFIGPLLMLAAYRLIMTYFSIRRTHAGSGGTPSSSSSPSANLQIHTFGWLCSISRTSLLSGLFSILAAVHANATVILFLEVLLQRNQQPKWSLWLTCSCSFLLAVCGLWTIAVLRSLGHLINAGVLSRFYFSMCVKGNSGNLMLDSMVPALTTSFGSVCMATLFGPIRWLRRMFFRPSNNGDGEMEQLSAMALVKVAIYGCSFEQAVRLLHKRNSLPAAGALNRPSKGNMSVPSARSEANSIVVLCDTLALTISLATATLYGIMGIFIINKGSDPRALLHGALAVGLVAYCMVYTGLAIVGDMAVSLVACAEEDPLILRIVDYELYEYLEPIM